MMLNQFGQPISLKSNIIVNLARQEDDILSHAPLLLTGCERDFSGLPKSWKGRLYTSEQIFEEIESDFRKQGQREEIFCRLPENIATTVSLSDTRTLAVTMIPLDAASKAVLYLTEDAYCRNLIHAEEDLKDVHKVFQTNTMLRRFIKDGIDTLYIDDSVFLQTPESQPQYKAFLFNLRKLVDVVRPNSCIGFRGGATLLLPDFIRELCREYDLHGNQR